MGVRKLDNIHANAIEGPGYWNRGQGWTYTATSLVGSTHQAPTSPSADICPHSQQPVMALQFTVDLAITQVGPETSTKGFLEQTFTGLGGGNNSQGAICLNTIEHIILDWVNAKALADFSLGGSTPVSR